MIKSISKLFLSSDFFTVRVESQISVSTGLTNSKMAAYMFIRRLLLLTETCPQSSNDCVDWSATTSSKKSKW